MYFTDTDIITRTADIRDTDLTSQPSHFATCYGHKIQNESCIEELQCSQENLNEWVDKVKGNLSSGPSPDVEENKEEHVSKQ